MNNPQSRSGGGDGDIFWLLCLISSPSRRFAGRWDNAVARDTDTKDRGVTKCLIRFALLPKLYRAASCPGASDQSLPSGLLPMYTYSQCQWWLKHGEPSKSSHQLESDNFHRRFTAWLRELKFDQHPSFGGPGAFEHTKWRTKLIFLRVQVENDV